MLFETSKRESFETRKARTLFNILPVYRGTRAKLKFVSADWKEVHILLPLNYKTRNITGTVFGGSIYSSLDPIFMAMLIRLLDRNEYVVWDKAATVRFLRPARTDIRARCIITDEQLNEIIALVKEKNEIDYQFTVQYLDSNNVVCAEIGKTVYVAHKEHYLEKRKKKGHLAEYKLKA